MAWFLQGPVDGSEVSCQGEIVPGAKTMTPRASADSQYKSKGGVQNCPGWRRQLIKPSVLGFRCNFWSRLYVSCRLGSGWRGGVVFGGPGNGCDFRVTMKLSRLKNHDTTARSGKRRSYSAMFL